MARNYIYFIGVNVIDWTSHDFYNFVVNSKRITPERHVAMVVVAYGTVRSDMLKSCWSCLFRASLS